MSDTKISDLPAAVAPVDTDLTALVQTNGAVLETRKATVAQIRGAVLTDRGAHVRDYGAKGDGSTDDGPAIQAAVNDLKAKGGGTLQFGARVYRVATAVTIADATIRFQGAGFTEGPGPGQGTWLRCDNTAIVPFTFTGVNARGAGMRDIAVVQAHTNSLVAGWVPNNYDYVFKVLDCLGGVDFDNVFLCNINRGIYCNNSGRLDIRRIRGQILTTGIEIDTCLDVPRIHSLHFWPFWTADANVLAYQQTQGDAMIFRRCDGVFADQAFALAYRSMFRFASSAAGRTTKFYIGQAYADFMQFGVWITADNTDGQIANFTHQGEKFNAGAAPLPGGAGMLIDASNCRVQVGNFRADSVEDNAIRLNGTGNRVDIFALRCVRFNLRNNGAAAIQLADSGAATPNAVFLGSPPLLEASNNGPVTNAGTNGILTLGAPAGRATRPGLTVGAVDTGLFMPGSGVLAGAAGGAEIMRATSAGTITLGGAPGGHAFEVTSPAGGVNRLVVTGSATGSGVSLQAQGADANVDITILPKGGGMLRAAPPPTGDSSTAVATTGWVRAQGYGAGGTGAGAVTSVAGRTGAVTLAAADIGNFAAAAAAAAPVASVAGRAGAVTLAVADVAGAAALSGAAFTGRVAIAPVTLADAATVALDGSLGNYFVLALAGNRTLTVANLVPGTTYMVEIRQDATGGRTLAWPTSFTWAGGAAGALTSAAGAIDVLTFATFNGTTIRAVLSRGFA